MAVEVTPAQAAAVKAARERYTDAEFISWLTGALEMNAAASPLPGTEGGEQQ